MKKLLFLSMACTTLFMSAFTQCYTCTFGTDTIEDYCGRGSELKDAVDVAESVGYTCEKR
jgi:hypothetical protein